MVLTLTRSVKSRPLNRMVPRSFPDYEVLAFCPGCKTVETLCFNNGWLVETRKFNQQGGQVFHVCNTLEPCRLYRIY